MASAQIPCSPALFGLTSESRIAELAHFENHEGGSSLKEAHVVQNLLDVPAWYLRLQNLLGI